MDHTQSFHMNPSLGASVAFDENGRSDYAERAIGGEESDPHLTCSENGGLMLVNVLTTTVNIQG